MEPLTYYVDLHCHTTLKPFADPDNPLKSHPSDPVYHENTFEWRAQWFPVPSSYCFNVGSLGIESPFWHPSSSLDAIERDALSDFQPADGWELVKRPCLALKREAMVEKGWGLKPGSRL